jgi:hypothetical protein
VPAITTLVALFVIVLGVTPVIVGFVSAGIFVRLAPDIAGSVAGNLASAKVPDAILEAFKSVVPAAFPFNPVLSIASANFLALVLSIY